MNIQHLSTKHLSALLSLKSLLLVVLCMLAANQVQAAGYSIECVDVNDPDTCSLVGQAAPNDEISNLVEDLFEAIQLDISAGNSCQLLSNDTVAICDLGEALNEVNLQLYCERSSTNTDDTIQCGLYGAGDDGREEIQGLLDIDCQKALDGTNGSCTISSDGNAVESRLRQLGVAGQASSFASNLLVSCALRAGTGAFQQDCNNVLIALAEGQTGLIANTLASVVPLNADFAMDATLRTVGIRLGHITDRLQRLRRGVRGADVTAMQFFDGQQWLSGGQMVASNADTMTDASPVDEFSRLGFFLDGSIVAAEQDASEQENDAELDSQLLTAGIDYRITDTLIGGLAFSVALSEADYGGNRGELDDQGFLLLAYGTYYVGSWYIDASIGLGGNDYEQTRYLRCSVSQCGQLIDQQAEADFSGEQTTVTIGAGYDLAYGALSVTPYAQLASIQLDIDGYRETMSDPNGAGAGFALDIENQSKDSLTFSVGTQVSYVLSQNWGVFVPHFDLQLYKEMEDDDLLVEGRFVGNVAIDDTFQLATNDIDTSYFIVGVGGLFQLQNGSTGFIDVKTMQGNDDIDEVQFTAGWRWEL